MWPQMVIRSNDCTLPELGEGDKLRLRNDLDVEVRHLHSICVVCMP